MSRRIGIIVGALVVIIAIGAGAFFFFTTPNTDITDASEGAEQLEASSEGAIVFTIDPEVSTAEYNIEEVLRGEDFTVVGTTNQVAGDVLVDLANPANSEIGEIRINARDFQTESSNRDGAVQRFILLSNQDEHEFITFNPTALNNMPDSVAVGDTIEFEVVGDLTVIDTTREETFTAEVTLVSETEIQGSVETSILYADYGINVPTPPMVASVEDDVTLKLDFVAVAGGGASESTEG
ncbi:MAG: YceI family protein [Chloroflexota bacterium]